FETQGKPADVYLVTDVSGSMSNFMDETKVAAKLFVDKIFNQSMDHGVGLASFQRNSYFDHGLSNDVDSLKQTIDDYTSGGMTCTCCGLNRGRNYVMSADDREKSIVLFSDGAPNYNCNGDLNNYYGSGFPWWTDKHAKQDAYASSDEACENDVNVYSIGYGDLLNEQEHQVLEKLACNESMYYRTTDEAELAQIFENISSRILLEANYSGQKIEFTGNLTNSKIYEDSYIDIYYEPNPDAEEVKHGEMPLDLRHNFEGCELDVYIPSEIGLQDAYVNSFSGNNWTKKLKVNGETVYDLDKYGRKYTFLGDPFQIKVPIDSLNAGEINNIKLEVGNEGNETDCSEFNSFIYTGMIDIIGATTPYSSVLPEASGCKWKIENYFGKNETIRVPPDYEGGNNCFYTNSSRGEEYFNEQDSYDVAMYNLLNYLDFNDDGRLSLSFESSDLEIDAHTIDQIPYLLGPMIAEVRVWK
ncbi:MAG: vWA domain-containing protein, partial [Nanoarchaeota archaeon]